MSSKNLALEIHEISRIKINFHNHERNVLYCTWSDCAYFWNELFNILQFTVEERNKNLAKLEWSEYNIIK